MYKEVKGDIFSRNPNYDVLVHGCNCHCTMGSGIARTVKEKYPKAYEADCKTVKGDVGKVGTYTCHQQDGITIVNAYTQYNYYPRTVDHFEYEGFRNICGSLNERFKGSTIAMPKIGAGLAGGNWDRIKQIILESFTDCDVIVFYL